MGVQCLNLRYLKLTSYIGGDASVPSHHPHLSRPYGYCCDFVQQAHHTRSLSLIQSACWGRCLYGMLLQTWLPSSNSHSSARLPASAAIRFPCSAGTSLSRTPWMTSRGHPTFSATPCRSNCFNLFIASSTVAPLRR